MIRVRGLELPEVIRDPLGSFVHRLRRSLPAEDYGGEESPDIQEHPARELLKKGAALGRAGRAEEAFGAYDALLKQFVETKEVQEEVVWALLNMALILASEGRTDDEISVYDELLGRFGQNLPIPQAPSVLALPDWLKEEGETSPARQESVVVHEQVAWALFNKGVALGSLGRTQEALVVYDELLGRFGGMTRKKEGKTGGLTLPDWLKGDKKEESSSQPERGVHEQVAWALFYKGVILKSLGHTEDAIAIFDQLLGRFGAVQASVLERLTSPGWLKKSQTDDAGSLEEESREQVAWALFNKGVALGSLGRTQEAMAAYDDLLRRFAGIRGGSTGGLVRPKWMKADPEPESTNLQQVQVREQVAWTLFNKGVSLGTLSRIQEALATYDELLGRFSQSRELDVQEPVARAMINRGVLESALQEQMARAPASQGQTLGTLGSTHDPSGFFDQATDPVQHTATTAQPSQGVQALVAKGMALGSTKEAIAIYDDVVGHFGRTTDPSVRKHVAEALINKGMALGSMGRIAEALVAYGEVITRFSDAKEAALREQVGRALLNKEMLEVALREQVAPGAVAETPSRPGDTRGTLGQTAEVTGIADEVASQFEGSTETDLPGQAAQALVEKGVALGNSAEALEVFDEVLSRFGEAKEVEVQQQVAEALGNKGMVLGTLGRMEEAMAVCDEVVRRFGQESTPALQKQVTVAMAKKEALQSILQEKAAEKEAEDRRKAEEQAIRQAQEAEDRHRAEELAKKEAEVAEERRLAEEQRQAEELAIKQAQEAEERRLARELAEKEVQEAEERRLAEEQRKAGELAKKEAQEAEERRLAEEKAKKEAQEAEERSLAEEQRKAGELAEKEAEQREARELVEKGVGLGSTEEALKVYDEVISRFGAPSQKAMREPVAQALVKKGLTLGALGRMEDVVEVCDEVTARFGLATEGEVQDQVAQALVTKGMALRSLGRWEEVIEAGDDMVSRFGETNVAELQEKVAWALVSKEVALRSLVRMEEVIEVCD